MIRVVVADDSTAMRELMVAVLEGDPEICVVATAPNGLAALEAVAAHAPDLVVMDVRMPRLDGYEATRRIMRTHPTPVVVVSAGLGHDDVEGSVEALAAGALAAAPKPGMPGEDFAAGCRRFVDTVKAMAAVPVVGHRVTRRAPPSPRRTAAAVPSDVVVVATSTGGPSALATLLGALPAGYPLPVAIVQHISRGFVGGLAAWLDGRCAIRVRVAEQGARLHPGLALLAPDERHLCVGRDGGVILDDGPPIRGFRPSADALFRSAASVYGARVLALQLTGMGTDGVEGLRAVSAAGGRVLAQDEASSVVYGMPAAAVEAGVVERVLPLEALAAALQEAAAARSA